MASKFTAGMKNVVEVLNQMWDAFAAGPYNALPLTGGTVTGPVSINSPSIYGRYNGNASGNAYLAMSFNSITYAYIGQATATTGGGADTDVGIRAENTLVFGAGGFGAKMKLFPTGNLGVGALADNGAHRLQVGGALGISSGGVQGSQVLGAGVGPGYPSMVVWAGNGVIPSQGATVLSVGKNSITDRGADILGTVNTMGNDYAEYIVKSVTCGPVEKGQIVGITAENTITDQWDQAVLFAIKSTAPSFVGGDSWASSIGPRPDPQAGPAPVRPPRRLDVTERQPLPGTEPPEYQDVVTPGDTDVEWATKQSAYATALASHAAAVQLDADAMVAFDAALEVERQKVDRIAIAGRVPVNVLGARPGDYIVPVQDGDGIAGVAVHADDIDMPQYLRAVGRVISIEADGRAYVMVKAV